MTGPLEAERLTLSVPDDAAGLRLDKALTAATERAGRPLSRSRLQQLIVSGAILSPNGAVLSDPKAKVKQGQTFTLVLPPPAPAEPLAEDIPLNIIFEDDDLLVVNKPAGMVVHPAPGAETGTLVNALLAHCGDTLPGIGGERRPGIVHRIDKDTSGLLVIAKSETSMTKLAARFATHDIEREYLGLCWGAPDRGDPRLCTVNGVSFEAGTVRIETEIARHKQDRKRMAVCTSGGRRAVTRLTTLEAFGPPAKRFAALVSCRLETGRTHQIRVHAEHIGHSLIGDPTYGRIRRLSKEYFNLDTALSSFDRQALHAAKLGFAHPVSGEILSFEAELPPDMHEILTQLRRNA